MILILLAAVSLCDAEEVQSGVGLRACYGRLAEQAGRDVAVQFALTLAQMRRDDVETRRDKVNRADMVPGLMASQRAWLRYRGAECNMVADQASGGNGGPAELGALCLLDLNRQLTADLKRRADEHLYPPAP